MSEMLIESFVESTGPAFRELLAIYHEAFELECREPDERLVNELNGDFRLPFQYLVARFEVHGPIIGFARFCPLAGTGMGFLLHIAVEGSHRGKGVGQSLLSKVTETMGSIPILVEIDRSGPVRDWYDKLGFVSITESYTQPQLYPFTLPVEYALCASVDVANKHGAVLDFYRLVWELDPCHPFVERALEGIRL